MSDRDRWWFFQSSSDNLIRFTSPGDFEVLVMNVEGDIGVIRPNATNWYQGDRLTGADDNQGLIQLPITNFESNSEHLIAVALRHQCAWLQRFGYQHDFFGQDQGTLYTVLIDSERQGSTIRMALAFGVTTSELTPDFDGVELDTIFVDGFRPKKPPSPPPITPRVSRYERKWVI